MRDRVKPGAANPTSSAHDEVTLRAVLQALERVPGARAPAANATTADLGRWLGAVHSITPDGAADLACLPVPLLSPGKAAVGRARKNLDFTGEPRPALEYALSWLDTSVPETSRIALTLGDAAADALEGGDALWRAAAWGDPAADLGWVSATLGLEPSLVDGLIAAHASAGQSTLRRPLVLYWQIMATVRRAVRSHIATARVRAGEGALDLALESAVAPVFELRALDLIDAFPRLATSGDR